MTKVADRLPVTAQRGNLTRLEDLEEALGIALGEMRKAFNGELEEMRAEIDRLRGELAAAPVAKYVGTWAHGDEVPAGAFVTCNGSLWYAKQTSRMKPGESDDFTLCVKRGRDGRDAR